MLTGHIISDLSIASLFGIRVLTEVGCEVTFTTTECIVKYRGKVILRGAKDPATDLWMLPLDSASVISPPVRAECPSATITTTDVHTRASHDFATFAHTVHTKANSIRFAHQSLCSPTIPTLLNSLMAICLLAGTENYLSVDFLRRNGTFFAIGKLNTTHKQHHHGELPPPPAAWL